MKNVININRNVFNIFRSKEKKALKLTKSVAFMTVNLLRMRFG